MVISIRADRLEVSTGAYVARSTWSCRLDLAALIRQIGYDERLHKIESEQNMLAARFG